MGFCQGLPKKVFSAMLAACLEDDISPDIEDLPEVWASISSCRTHKSGTCYMESCCKEVQGFVRSNLNLNVILVSGKLRLLVPWKKVRKARRGRFVSGNHSK